MNHRLTLSIRALVAALVLAASSASAAITWHDVQFGGFLSQGYLTSDGNNYPFVDKDGTADFRELGLNASTTFGSHLRVGGQIFAQRLGEYGEDKVKLDWAVVDYNVLPEFGVRLGRVKYPKGLYGEALDVDAIRPFIFLPISNYNPIVRDFNSAVNGGLVYGSLGAGSVGSFDYKAFYGHIPVSPDQGVADFFNTSGIYKNGVESLGMDYAAGSSIDWSTPVTGLKIHGSYSWLENMRGSGLFAPVPFPAPITISLDRLAYLTFGAEYVRNGWTLAAEWQSQSGNATVDASPFANSVGAYGSKNYYVSAARRLNEKWELGGYYSVARNSHPAAGTPRGKIETDDYALCVRYDFNEHVIFKIEGHYIDGTYNMFNTMKTPNPTLNDTTTLFAAKVTFSF